MTSLPTPFVESAQESYDEMLYKGQYDRADALQERVYEDIGITLKHTECNGTGEIDGVLCYCNPKVEDLTDNYDHAYGE